MKAVRFKRHHSLYNEGEVAGFEDAHAEDLVRRGIASFERPEPEAAAEVQSIDQPIAPAPESEVKAPGWLKKKK